MKAIYTLVSLLLIYSINSNTLDEFPKTVCSDYDYKHPEKPAFSLDFCRTTDYGDSARCCFLKWEDPAGNRRYSCYPINGQELADIDETIGTLESEEEIGEVVSLDCNSSYLFGSLLLILSLLF